MATSIPASLIDEKQLEGVSGIAARVPHVWHSFGFECRLGSDGGAVDLGVAVQPRGGGREALAGRTENAVLARAVSGNAAWSRLTEFAQRWSDPSSRMHAWIPFLFLEFDAHASEEAIPTPSVFVALDAPLEVPHGNPHLHAAREACDLLLGAASTERLWGAVRACFDALPAGGNVLHLGAMLGRSQRGIRLSVALPGASVIDFLRDRSAKESMDPVAAVLARFPRWLDQVQLDFDLAPEGQPRMGFGVRPPRADVESWRHLLGDLTAHGICQPERARGALCWLDASHEHTIRELSHVKLVVAPDAPLTAKIYLGARARGARLRHSG